MAYCPRAKFPIKAKDGWYHIDIIKREIVEPGFFPSEIGTGLRAYSVNGQFVPTNFDAWKRAAGTTVVHSISLLSESVEDFDVIKVAYIRGGLFYHGMDYMSPTMFAVKRMIDNDEKVRRLKTMTPEQVYAAGAYAMKVAEEKKKLMAQSLEGRILECLSVAGATLHDYKELASGYVDVIWSFLGEKFKTTILKTNMMVYNLGICVSGGDKEHSLASAPDVAKYAIESGELHKTQEAE